MDIDWNALRALYVTSLDSYAKIARSMGMKPNTIAKKGKEEDWPEQRRIYREEAMKRALEGEITEEAERLKKLMFVVNKLQDEIANAFEDEHQFNRHLVQCERYDGEVGAALKDTEERIYTKKDTRALKDLTGAVKDLLYSVRNLYGLPTQGEKEAQRIAAERLEMDRRKAQLGEDSDKTITVELKGLEEYSK